MPPDFRCAFVMLFVTRYVAILRQQRIHSRDYRSERCALPLAMLRRDATLFYAIALLFTLDIVVTPAASPPSDASPLMPLSPVVIFLIAAAMRCRYATLLIL